MATIIPVGVQAKYFAQLESTYNTRAGFAVTDAVPFINLEITPTYEFHAVKERVASASLQGEVKGTKGGTWSASMYLKPYGAGAANTVPPDVGPAILAAAFGNELLSGGVRYRMHDGSNEVTAAKSLQISRQAGGAFWEQINGAWIETIDFEATGNAEPTVTVSGGFAGYAWCYGGQINGAHSSSDTTIQMKTNTAERLSVDSTIQFSDGEDNGGHGYHVSAVDKSTDIITISPGLVAGVSGDTFIQPVDKSQTLSVNGPLDGVTGTLSLLGTAGMGFISFKVSMKTGIHGLAGEATNATVSRLSMGQREVTGEIQCYFLTSETAAEDFGRFVGATWDGASGGIIVNIGPGDSLVTAQLNCPNSRLEVTPISLPEADEATAAVTFVARQSATGGDELNLFFP
jgi:hypothetical protein